MFEGNIKWYNEAKGFGFIESNGGDVFLHVTDIIGDNAPKEGDVVQYDIEEAPRGQQAKNVQLLD